MKEKKVLPVNKIMRTGIIIAACLCLFLKSSEALAADSESQESQRFLGTEIVFLLDTSASMNKQDKERAAIDAIRQMAYSLPSDYRIGLVAYHTGIQTLIPLTSDMELLDKTLDDIKYTGYTNAGEGLSEAVKLFSNNIEKEKYIIMISDGEIDMPDDEEKEQSRTKYLDAAKSAKEKNIRINIAAIGTEINAKMNIFDGAQITGGSIYWEGQSGTVAQIMEQIISGQLSIPRQELGVTDAGGGSVYAGLPANADRVKIILTGNTDLKEVSADYMAEQGHTTVGKQFAVIEMKRPSSEVAAVNFQTKDITGVKAYLLTEYTAKPLVDVFYKIKEIPRTEKEIQKNIPPVYEHYADITIQLTDSAGDGGNLWEKETWEGKEVSCLLNGTFYTAKIQQGKLQVTIPADEIETVEVFLDLGDVPEVVYIEQPITLKIEKYPDPVSEPAPDYRPLWAVLILLAAAILVIVLIGVRRKNTTVIYMAASQKEPEKKLETKNCTYSGRFSIYVIRTRDDRDIPPQTYPLFGQANGRLTLDKILSSCKIKFGKIGAEDIIFYPGPEHSIIMMDQSEACTVMRGAEIMKKGVGYPVFYNEKITVAFEDNATELEIHYKNLLPVERNKIKRNQ